ncbi:MAG: hypothetical protein AB7G17_01000 [Phycisphaerales bacterium]
MPMPRRRLRARDVLHQAGVPEGAVLVRDLNSPIDIGFASDAMVDLAEGNVFRLLRGCTANETGAHGAQPKLAFIVDDAWEITIEPRQTAESLRGLFDLDDEVELVRDYESPDDEPVGEATEVLFRDGPVFVTRKRSVTIKVNRNDVKMPRRRATGLEIKQAAVRQGVRIQLDFLLYRIVGGEQVRVPDDKQVTLHECDEFRCVAPDDNS